MARKKRKPQGTHAEAWEQAVEQTKIEVKEAMNDRLAAVVEDYSTIAADILQQELDELNVPAVAKELDDAIKLHKELMMQAAELSVLDRAVAQVRQSLTERVPVYAEFSVALKRAKQELRTVSEENGLRIDAVPKNHPVVQRIDGLQQSLAEMEDRALAPLLAAKEAAESTYTDAPEYLQYVNNLWAAERASSS